MGPWPQCNLMRRRNYLDDASKVLAHSCTPPFLTRGITSVPRIGATRPDPALEVSAELLGVFGITECRICSDEFIEVLDDKPEMFVHSTVCQFGIGRFDPPKNSLMLEQ